jgi:hypothetical protein
MESFITKPQSLQQCPVLIIDAGMVGLTLAQTLKKVNKNSWYPLVPGS